LKGRAPEIAILIRQDKQITENNNDLDRVYQKSLAILESRINAGDYSAKQLKDALLMLGTAFVHATWPKTVLTPQFHKNKARKGERALGWLPDRIESG
jgi:hypothetical protein